MQTPSSPDRISARHAARWLPLLLVAAGTACAAEPAIGFEDCRLENPAGFGAVAARCGRLGVPENPDAATGRQIELHVAVVPALNRRARPDPLFVLAGGPGQAAGEFFAAYAGAFAAIGRERDIVLVDQRGTGQSAPLNCDYPEDPDSADVDLEQLKEATRTCLAGLKADPRFYTTSLAVRDLDAVRAALGAQHLNLYGISYGTRVAQHYLRRYPQHVRTLILDGAVPPQVALGSDMALDAQRALDGIFARCTADAACATRFPDIAGEFAALSERLITPVSLTFPDPATGALRTLEFGRVHLSGVARLLSYADGTAALLPLLIHAARQGNFTPLAAQYVLLERSIEAQFAYGMHNAVVCTEDIPLLDASQVDLQRLAATYLGSASLEALQAICNEWPRGAMDTDLHAALGSDVPVLVLSGGSDPITPPRYGEQVAGQFTRSHHLVIDGHGHGQLAAPCIPGLLARFIDQADPQLDTQCIATVRAQPFLLDFTGPAP